VAYRDEEREDGMRHGRKQREDRRMTLPSTDCCTASKGSAIDGFLLYNGESERERESESEKESMKEREEDG